MDQKLNSLKNQIDSLRTEKGKKTRIPRRLWTQIAKCSEKLPLKIVCAAIGINPTNARSKIKSLSKTKKSFKGQSASPFNIVQLQQTPTTTTTTTTTPIMELSLSNGAIIRVFSV